MKQVNISEAKTKFSSLLRRVAAGEEITIAKGGAPVARLVPICSKTVRRTLGMFRGEFMIPDDFDAPLPDEIMGAFEGKETQNPKKA